MGLAYGHNVGDKLKFALGLPAHTKGFEIRCYVNEIVTIKCEYYPEIEGIIQLETVLKEYELHEKENADAISNNTQQERLGLEIHTEDC